MGMVCELRQISPDYAQRLLHNPDEIWQYYENADEGELPEEAHGEELDLDKAWHGLHYILTKTAAQGEEPWGYLLTGGVQVGDEEEHNVGYGPARILTLQQVAAFQQAIATVTPIKVSNRFNPAEMTRQDIYPNVWDRQDEPLEEWMQGSLAELQSFLKRAVELQQVVIISLA